MKTWTQDTQKIALLLSAISFLLLLTSLFSLSTLLFASVFLFSLLILLRTKCKHFRQHGLQKYMSRALVHTLVNRSIFDVLCDIWFFPKISVYVRKFLTPFLYEMTPHDALREFMLDMTQREQRVLLNKGILNIFPQPVQRVILPQNMDIAALRNMLEDDELPEDHYEIRPTRLLPIEEENNQAQKQPESDQEDNNASPPPHLEEPMQKYVKLYGYDRMKQWNQMIEYRRQNPPEEPKFSVKTVMQKRVAQQIEDQRRKLKISLGSKHLKTKMFFLIVMLIAQVVLVKRIRGWGKKLGLAAGFIGTLGGLGVNLGLWRFRRILN